MKQHNWAITVSCSWKEAGYVPFWPAQILSPFRMISFSGLFLQQGSLIVLLLSLGFTFCAFSYKFMMWFGFPQAVWTYFCVPSLHAFIHPSSSAYPRPGNEAAVWAGTPRPFVCIWVSSCMHLSRSAPVFFFVFFNSFYIYILWDFLLIRSLWTRKELNEHSVLSPVRITLPYKLTFSHVLLGPPHTRSSIWFGQVWTWTLDSLIIGRRNNLHNTAAADIHNLKLF